MGTHRLRVPLIILSFLTSLLSLPLSSMFVMMRGGHVKTTKVTFNTIFLVPQGDVAASKAY